MNREPGKDSYFLFLFAKTRFAKLFELRAA